MRAHVRMLYFLTLWRVGLLKIDLNRPTIARQSQGTRSHNRLHYGASNQRFFLTFKKLAPPVFNFNYLGEKL